MLDNNLFTGVIITSTAGSRTVAVVREEHVNAGGDMGFIIQGTIVSSVMAVFLGFKECTVPQPGSRVLCVLDGNRSCFILGILPQSSTTLTDLPNRACLGAKNALADGANRLGHLDRTPTISDNRRPTDVVDGEYVQGNEFGVLLGLYQQMANLKASELAQVQCFLLDDLVRIISHNFQHYTAIGEYNVYHDGKRLMAEFGATHKTSESYGRPAVNSDTGAPVFSEEGSHTVDDKADFYKFEEDERIKAIERFKLFLGSVGDFVHLYVVRPNPDEVRKLDHEQPENPDTGLCDLHIGTDGGLHIRSVKEIFIEKTQWIRVPLRVSAPDDQKGDDAEELDYETKKKFEFKDEYKYKENPFLYALQIRDYVAYVNEKLGYQNFKKHEKDFYVNDDIAKEKGIDTFGKVDQETESNLQDYKLRTAGFYLMPNGGITIRDAWNSAIVMEGGNIYLQPAKDLVQQPLRNSIVKAGGHINMACKKHIDLSSSEEGLRLKSEKAQYFYSEKGGIVIEAGGENDTPGTPDPTEQALEDIGGVVLKSKLGIYNYAEKNIVSYAKEKILMQSLKSLDMTSKRMTLYGRDNLHLFADQQILQYAGLGINLFSDSQVNVAGATGTNLGQDEQNLGIMYDEDSMFIDILKGVIKVSELTSKLGEALEAKEELLKQTVFGEEQKFDDLQFKFLSSQQYGKLDPQEDGIPATLAQQDDLLTEMYGLEEWEEKEVNESLPYPGKDLFENFYYSAEKPVNLEKNNMGKDYSSKADSTEKPGEIKLESLNKYKIQS